MTERKGREGGYLHVVGQERWVTKRYEEEKEITRRGETAVQKRNTNTERQTDRQTGRLTIRLMSTMKFRPLDVYLNHSHPVSQEG